MREKEEKGRDIIAPARSVSIRPQRCGDRPTSGEGVSVRARNSRDKRGANWCRPQIGSATLCCCEELRSPLPRRRLLRLLASFSK